ncbi:type VII secretion protein [Bacillus thuringiensis serovar brasilensis]|uniref:WXG100 family type VII secretion target n=1 Tax=Bacillus cereus group TaxID=86661 RepID=UPI000A3ABF02|nr:MULTISPECIES: WXG100 family type VII secretion target [Bacillus cereus group]MCU5029149.1 WXG100 family type VII secretion target [Bacillus cereus]MRA73314.1 WXG100 family type VII secretion target [Bacillus thuringiensis]MRA90170.1 WXG100 family type VII secretion target [Bacillus thuringiensis]MRC52721.1 WXG100 family type VII secretion target [Bacillus thuringiensis]OTX37572.1 type VII secretion protein [Bacillus thuringiensis serovar brasilensis]
MEIKVKPEQLEQIAKNISEMQTHSQNIQQNLNQSMFSIQMQWQGATSQHFYGEYMRSMRLMESYIRNLQVTEKELRRIAQKFRQADEEYQKKQNEKLKEAHKKEKKNEKSWWEKGIEGAAEFIGVNDAIRAVTGKDPITGKELSTKERLIAAGWTLLNFVPVGKVASLAGKGIKYVASSFGKTIVKAGKKLGEGVTMVAGKAAVDGIKTASHKVKEGVNFVASTAKGFADKIGSLWNKGATTVKTTFLQGNEKIQHAVKTLMEYKWIPGEGKGFAMAGVGNVSGGGQYSLKEAYQYVESKVVKGTGKSGSTVSEVKTFVDKGKHFTNGRKNRLKPNIRYKTGEYDYFYETDNLGRIEKFETDKLQLTEREKRLSHSKNTLGKVKGQDHAGHLAGDRFGGSPKIDNLVSQLSDVNMKQYKKIENEWAAALKEKPPKEVTVDVEIIYHDNDMRPKEFIVNYSIDGKAEFRVIKN